jgi:hypothetical protein
MIIVVSWSYTIDETSACWQIILLRYYGLQKVKLKKKWPGRLEKTQI